MPSHAISCTPIPPWSSSKCRNTPSTNQLHVFAFQVGRSVWLKKDYCLNTSSSKFFRQGENAWNLFDFDNQSAANFCVDTIKYCSIPSVPSGLEGVKTRPDVWGGRGTVVVPRGVGWRSGLAAGFWVCYTRHVFKDRFGHHHHHHNHCRGALYSKDT